MSFFKTTKSGKCDVSIKIFTKNNELLFDIGRTFDVKPTLKELKTEYKKYKDYGANYMILTRIHHIFIRFIFHFCIILH